MDGYYYAKLAYEAYRKFSDGKSLISGQTIPEFEYLKDPIKNAWNAAVIAVVDDQQVLINRINSLEKKMDAIALILREDITE